MGILVNLGIFSKLVFSGVEKKLSCRDYMPNFTTDESPFTVRLRIGKRQEELALAQSAAPPIKNPSMTGQASTSSTASSGTRWGSKKGQDWMLIGYNVDVESAVQMLPHFSYARFSSVKPENMEVECY